MENVPVNAVLLTVVVTISFVVPPRPSVYLSRGNLVFGLLLLIAVFEWGRFVGARKR